MNNSSRTSQWRHVPVNWHEPETGVTFDCCRACSRSLAAGPECEWRHHFRGHVSLEFFLSRGHASLEFFLSRGHVSLEFFWSRPKRKFIFKNFFDIYSRFFLLYIFKNIFYIYIQEFCWYIFKNIFVIYIYIYIYISKNFFFIFTFFPHIQDRNSWMYFENLE